MSENKIGFSLVVVDKRDEGNGGRCNFAGAIVGLWRRVRADKKGLKWWISN